MNEQTIAWLRKCLQDARYEQDLETKLNAVLEALDDLLYNLPIEED